MVTFNIGVKSSVRAASRTRCRGIEPIAEQVQEHPRYILRVHFDRRDPVAEVSFQRDIETLILGAGAVIGEVQRLIDQRVEIDRPPFARRAARMFQHGLDDAVGAFAVLGRSSPDCSESAWPRRPRPPRAVRRSAWLSRREQLPSIRSSSSTERAAKLLTKLSGFLISCAMPAVSWPSEAIFSAWIRLAWAVFSSRKAASIVRLASCAASRAAAISASLRLRSVMSAIDQHETAAGHRVVADFDHAAIGTGAIIGAMLAGSSR